MRDWGIYYGTVDARIYPTVRIYLPNRSTPMATINANDSIFWEETGNGPFVQGNLISEEELIKQASDFAGTIPVKTAAVLENRQPLSVLRRFRKHARCRRICSGQAMEHSHRAMEANLRYPKGKKRCRQPITLLSAMKYRTVLPPLSTGR